MNWQMIVVLISVAGATVYFGRGFLLGLTGKGGCASGGSCSSCGEGGCTLTKLETLRREWEAKKS